MSYIGTQPTQLTLETRQEFVATALQTTFNTNPYTVGYVDCYLNGVKLSTSDFTANNGNQVVLGTGAAANDILAVVMKKPDHYPLPITDSAGNNVLSESGGVVTLNNGTIGSSVVFPSNHLIGFGYGEETSSTGDINNNSTGFQSSDLKGIIFGTEINVGSVLDGQKVIFTLMGGQAYFNSDTSGGGLYYNTSCGIAYNTDNTTPTTSSTRVILWSSDWVQLATGSSSVSPCGSHVIANSSGSTQTIKIKFWAGANDNFSNVNIYSHWDGSRDYNSIRYQYYILSA